MSVEKNGGKHLRKYKCLWSLLHFLPLIKNQVEIISGFKSVLFIEQLLLNSPISAYSSQASQLVSC